MEKQNRCQLSPSGMSGVISPEPQREGYIGTSEKLHANIDNR
jgi:hypothetical protein